MNRNAFVSGIKLVRKFLNVPNILKIGSTWNAPEEGKHSIVRIVKYNGIQSSNHVFKIERCREARWYKRNAWRDDVWIVGDDFMRNVFPKHHNKVFFIEPFGSYAGWSLDQMSRHSAFFAMLWSFAWGLYEILKQSWVWAAVFIALGFANTWLYYRAIKKKVDQ